MSAPAAAPPAVYSLCSGVHDAHDETIKRTTVAAAPIQLFHLITATPPWVSSDSGIKHCAFCHFLDPKSIEEANFSHSPGFVMMGIRYIGYIWLHKEAAAAPDRTAAACGCFSLGPTY
jgi:hypothetical protein